METAEEAMPEPRLLVKCLLDGLEDCAGVQILLEQYGLRTVESDGYELLAEGTVPSVLAQMQCGDIETHLTARIEDAVPGTRVALIRATLRKS